jgi:hypothetical protein
MASQETWSLFEKEDMVQIVDADITSSICFLTGVCSGSMCVIVVAAWTHTVHQSFTATLSLLTFFIGYLLVGTPYLTTFFFLHIFIWFNYSLGVGP